MYYKPFQWLMTGEILATTYYTDHVLLAAYNRIR